MTYEGNYNARPRHLTGRRATWPWCTTTGATIESLLVDVERAYTQVLSDGTQDESPSFAPNGEVIIFASRARVAGKAYCRLVSDRRPGAAAHRGDTEGDVREPAWSPFQNN